MKRYKYLVGWWMLLALLASCNESLEDTYSDYAGDGKIRYPGKCFDLSVKPGWQRLIVEWTNSVDATVKNVKLSWSASGVKRDTLLNRSATSCDLRNLTDGTYRVDVSTGWRRITDGPIQMSTRRCFLSRGVLRNITV